MSRAQWNRYMGRKEEKKATIATIWRHKTYHDKKAVFLYELHLKYYCKMAIDHHKESGYGGIGLSSLYWVAEAAQK